MKLQEITIIYKRTVQMRSYEPADISIAIRAAVDPGETVAQVSKKLRDEARQQIEIERQHLLDQRLASYDDDKEKAA